MISYTPYSDYKPSELEWLGEIPTAWKTTRIKFIGDLILGLTYSPDDVVSDGGTLVLRSSNVQNGKLDLDDRVYVSCDIPKKILTKRDDILICSRNGSRALIGKCALLTDEVVGQAFGAFMTVLRSQQAHFLYYVLNSSLFNFQAGRFLTSTINQLTTQTLGDFKIALPPEADQQAIARFLDFKTAQIDALIAKKKSLLDKLAEKRTALISHVVTKGLDPSVPMKDSGVSWLGDIPANWDIGQFSHFIFFQEGPGIMAVDFHDSGVPLLRIHNVQNEVVSLDGCNYLDPEKVRAKWAHFRLRTGDLLISCSASTGLVSEVDSNSEGAVAYTGIIRLNAARPEISKEFIKVLVGSSLFFEQIAVLKTGTTLQHFGPAHLRRMFITLPPINEQIKIVRYIKNECSLIDAQTQKIQVAIELLTEYRSALITNAVTGKIDVRGFEIPQPVEAQEPAHA